MPFRRAEKEGACPLIPTGIKTGAEYAHTCEGRAGGRGASLTAGAAGSSGRRAPQPRAAAPCDPPPFGGSALGASCGTRRGRAGARTESARHRALRDRQEARHWPRLGLQGARTYRRRARRWRVISGWSRHRQHDRCRPILEYNPERDRLQSGDDRQDR
jgi:hypothetical protein